MDSNFINSFQQRIERENAKHYRNAKFDASRGIKRETSS